MNPEESDPEDPDEIPEKLEFDICLKFCKGRVGCRERSDLHFAKNLIYGGHRTRKPILTT